MDMPSYTMRPKCAKVENNPRHPPGPGPFEYETRHMQTLRNNRQPTWIVPKAKRVSEALPPVGESPDEVGPGKYENTNWLVCKYPNEAYEHRNVNR